jgi:hypothetical protein
VQGFPLRLAPGAPHSLRLLAGHPFSQKQHSEGEQEELAQQLMTQLAPEQQLVAAQIMSSEQLPTFKVCILPADLCIAGQVTPTASASELREQRHHACCIK